MRHIHVSYAAAIEDSHEPRLAIVLAPTCASVLSQNSRYYVATVMIDTIFITDGETFL